jgi:hypothetical protein
VQLLSGGEREPGAKIEAHLVAEHRHRAGAGAVALLHAVRKHMFHQFEILTHRLLKAPRLTASAILASGPFRSQTSLYNP